MVVKNIEQHYDIIYTVYKLNMPVFYFIIIITLFNIFNII